MHNMSSEMCHEYVCCGPNFYIFTYVHMFLFCRATWVRTAEKLVAFALQVHQLGQQLQPPQQPLQQQQQQQQQQRKQQR